MESEGTLISEARLPGKQGLVAATYLILTRTQPTTRDELAEVIWGNVLAESWETSLNAIVSKVRTLLRPAGVSITSPLGRYQLVLPASAWVDVEAARNSLDEAEGALRSGSYAGAWGPANIAACIAKRGFLSGIESPWATRERTKLQEYLVRALDCLSDVSMRNREPSLAVQHAEESVRAAPFREVGYPTPDASTSDPRQSWGGAPGVRHLPQASSR